MAVKTLYLMSEWVCCFPDSCVMLCGEVFSHAICYSPIFSYCFIFFTADRNFCVGFTMGYPAQYWNSTLCFPLRLECRIQRQCTLHSRWTLSSSSFPFHNMLRYIGMASLPSCTWPQLFIHLNLFSPIWLHSPMAPFCCLNQKYSNKPLCTNS